MGLQANGCALAPHPKPIMLNSDMANFPISGETGVKKISNGVGTINNIGKVDVGVVRYFCCYYRLNVNKVTSNVVHLTLNQHIYVRPILQLEVRKKRLWLREILSWKSCKQYFNKPNTQTMGSSHFFMGYRSSIFDNCTNGIQ